MPTLEYRCQLGHVTEKFFKSISEGEKAAVVVCAECSLRPGSAEFADKIFSVPMEAMLYGDPAGYGKPSATKRHSTKTVSAKTGNQSATG